MNIEKYLDQFFKDLKHTPGPWSMDDGHLFTDDKNREYNSIATIHDIWKNDGTAEPNSKLIAQSPELLRTICRTYLMLLIKFAYGQNGTCNEIRISLDGTLSDLRNQISIATGLQCQHIQDVFEQYALKSAN